MDQNVKMMLTGSAITLLVVGGVAGLWSMTVAPAPPAVVAAQREENLVRAEVREKMDLFLALHSRAEGALAASAWDRAAAHILVMREVAEEMKARHLQTKLPSEGLVMLNKALEDASTHVAAKDPSAAASVAGIKNACAACHQLAKGPRFGTVITGGGEEAPAAK